jgi:hypothetical protein
VHTTGAAAAALLGPAGSEVEYEDLRYRGEVWRVELWANFNG